MSHNRWSSLLTLVELTALVVFLANFALSQYWMDVFVGFENELPTIRESWLNASIFLFVAPISIFFYWQLQEILLKELAL